jgi:hypothetical protein
MNGWSVLHVEYEQNGKEKNYAKEKMIPLTSFEV